MPLLILFLYRLYILICIIVFSGDNTSNLYKLKKYGSDSSGRQVAIGCTGASNRFSEPQMRQLSQDGQIKISETRDIQFQFYLNIHNLSLSFRLTRRFYHTLLDTSYKHFEMRKSLFILNNK